MGASLSLCEQDFYAWTQEQAKILKNKTLDKLDLIHLQEELQIMGASEKRELTHRLEILLMLLLKWKYQPELQCNSWRYTINEQRDQLQYHLEDNPSLRNPEYFATVFSCAYKSAIREAAKETGFPIKIFPQTCEWSINQIINEEFLPT